MRHESPWMRARCASKRVLAVQMKVRAHTPRTMLRHIQLFGRQCERRTKLALQAGGRPPANTPATRSRSNGATENSKRAHGLCVRAHCSLVCLRASLTARSLALPARSQSLACLLVHTHAARRATHRLNAKIGEIQCILVCDEFCEILSNFMCPTCSGLLSLIDARLTRSPWTYIRQHL